MTLSFKVKFVSPAFLGNAQQAAQWRTPPFKALIRQWWRVVKAKEVGYDVAELLAAENRLFGSASADGSSGRSLLRLRLEDCDWEEGGLKEWPGARGEVRFPHPEVKRFPSIGAEVYLGYGPLGPRGGVSLSEREGKRRSAIAPVRPEGKAMAMLRVSLARDHGSQVDHEAEIRNALQLAAWFGTLGARSRNGWGALAIEGEGIEQEVRPGRIDPFSRDLDACLQTDWPHAVGRDAVGLLVWRGRPCSSWREAMGDLAKIKIAFRTHDFFKFPQEAGPHTTLQARHLLSYPVTNHGFIPWDREVRLGNQIRFKILEDGGQLRPWVVHLPCSLPSTLVAKIPVAQRQGLAARQLEAWRTVHQVLDQHDLLSRVGGKARP